MNLPAIILINPKYKHNVGAVIRACACFGVENFLWTGDRVNPETYERLPREERMKGYSQVNWQRVDKPLKHLPEHITPVAVEIRPSAETLTTFEHPEDAVYIFGPEDGSIPQVYRRLSHRFVFIPSHFCLNLACAVNVVLYDRRAKRQIAGLEPILPPGEMLHEHRGEVETPVMDAVGWDGK